jgi:hypothetical protein
MKKETKPNAVIIKVVKGDPQIIRKNVVIKNVPPKPKDMGGES